MLCLQVEDIVGMRDGDNGKEYLVKWHGYDDAQNTWEPETNLRNEYVQRIVRRYHVR